MPTAVIFDFDGVLADTEPLHFAALRDTLAGTGLALGWDVYRDRLIGFDDRGVFRTVFAEAGRPLPPSEERRLIDDKGRRFAGLCRASRLEPLPGVAALLASLRDRVPLALCSGALPADIEPILDRFGWSDVFEIRVTAADVAASKPDPAGYELTLRRLRARHPGRELAARSTVAIEDTAAGVAAARGAGLSVVHLGGGNGESTRRDGIWPVATLEGVTWEQLNRVFGA